MTTTTTPNTTPTPATTTAPATKPAPKMTQAAVLDRLTCDGLSLRGGVFTARRGFFYTSGKTHRDFADRVQATFPEATVLDSGEVWKPFRGGAPLTKQSHWWVTFTFRFPR